MDGGMHRWRIAVACLTALLLIGALVRADGGSPTVRAQEAGVPAAATPVAVPPAPKEPVVSLVVERTGAAFGDLSGTGEVDPAEAEVTSSVDESGAFYVREGAIRVTVTSDGPWSGSCHAGENGGSATTLRVADGRLAWRLAGTEAWTAFGIDLSGSAAGACFPDRPLGTTTYVYDLRLRVERTDPPGTFAAAITFVVTAEGPA